MNPGILLSSGMNPSCTRRAASLESVTPSYRRTVKYALMVMILRVLIVYVFFPETFWGRSCTVSQESGLCKGGCGSTCPDATNWHGTGTPNPKKFNGRPASDQQLRGYW